MIKVATKAEIDDLKRQIINHENLSKPIKEIFLALVNNSCCLTKTTAFVAEEEIFPALLRKGIVRHCVIHERRCLTVERNGNRYLTYLQPDVSEKNNFSLEKAIVIELEDIEQRKR